MSDAEQSAAQPPPGAPKRRGKGRRSHTVAKVMLASAVVLGLVTGLSVVYLYRHLNGNLNAIDLTDEIGTNRPVKQAVEGPKEPLNVLVMGSDTREGAGNNIDNLTGLGERSDTVVDRPTCKAENGDSLPGGTRVLWNEAFSVGGPACTMRQFEQLSGVRLDHFVVVDFEGFRDMVDAIGGVEVCIPETIDDREHGIFLEAGTRKIAGQEALNYVRERYAVSGGSDIGRMKRQQAFIASMAHQLVTAGTLANPIKIVKFLEAATKSLTVDEEIGSLKKLGALGYEFRDIGLSKIQFLTIPNQVDPADPNHLVWTPAAKQVWNKIIEDKPLTKRLATDVISAGNVPGSSSSPSPSDRGSESPNGGPSKPSGSPSGDASEADAEALQEAGLCA
jgi:LCP family protein required for cell wall assembly